MKELVKILTVLSLIALLGVCDAGWMQERFVFPDPGGEFTRVTDITGYVEDYDVSPTEQKLKVYFDEGSSDACYIMYGREGESQAGLAYWDGTTGYRTDLGLPMEAEILPLNAQGTFGWFFRDSGAPDYEEYYLNFTVYPFSAVAAGFNGELHQSQGILAFPIGLDLLVFFQEIAPTGNEMYWLYKDATNVWEAYAPTPYTIGLPPDEGANASELTAMTGGANSSTPAINTEFDNYVTGSGIWDGDFGFLGYGFNTDVMTSYFVINRKDVITDEDTVLLVSWDGFTLSVLTDIPTEQDYFGYFNYNGGGYTMFVEKLDYPQKYVLHVYDGSGSEVNTLDVWGRNIRFMGNTVMDGTDVLLFQLEGDAGFYEEKDGSINVSVFSLPKSVAAGG